MELDEVNCPRDDGGRLRKMGDFSRDRYNPGDTEPHWECSVCLRWWTAVELKRLP